MIKWGFSYEKSSKNIIDNIYKLKEIFGKISESKGELKTVYASKWTLMKERKDELLLEFDILFLWYFF